MQPHIKYVLFVILLIGQLRIFSAFPLDPHHHCFDLNVAVQNWLEST